jgi:hypothetical protein
MALQDDGAAGCASQHQSLTAGTSELTAIGNARERQRRRADRAIVDVFRRIGVAGDTLERQQCLDR